MQSVQLKHFTFWNIDMAPISSARAGGDVPFFCHGWPARDKCSIPLFFARYFFHRERGKEIRDAKQGRAYACADGYSNLSTENLNLNSNRGRSRAVVDPCGASASGIRARWKKNRIERAIVIFFNEGQWIFEFEYRVGKEKVPIGLKIRRCATVIFSHHKRSQLYDLI